MKIAKFAVAAFAAASLATAAQAGEVAVGATVYGPEGNPVGKIESVANGQAVLDTGKHKVPLGLDSFGQGETGPTITVTKATLDGMMDQQIAAANAKRDAALIVTAAVVTADSQALGLVDSIEGDTVIVEREAGPVTLMREHFAVDGNGQLMALFTLAQIEAALAAQTEAQVAGTQ